MLRPRQAVPELIVPTVDGPRWSLADQKPSLFTMVLFYRGLHCPICKRTLADLNRKAEEFDARGVPFIAISSDGLDRARRAKEEWGLDRVTVGHDLSIDKAREWGLFISTSRGKTSMGVVEPDEFSEPGLFLLTPERTLFGAIVQTMPFARPYFADVLSALDFIVRTDYPARGQA